ncbi:hypothetical protein SDC9_60815 [bioreactor metagenome]|uniref:Uncharacterized protein n=1 Tax=bioreactor metagenome TaxID=1076179 RepID=A0A644XJQ9_9ZZZZ
MECDRQFLKHALVFIHIVLANVTKEDNAGIRSTFIVTDRIDT